MNKKRILKLADYLEKEVPKKYFDMDNFAFGNFVQHECGSSACAIGWATVVFPKLLGITPGSVVYLLADVYEEGYGAMAKVLGIREPKSFALFNSLGTWRTPRAMAKKLRNFVKTGRV